MVANLSVEADNAISRGDYYVAAIHLLTLLGNPGIDEKIQSITGKVSGGLMMESSPPYFNSFLLRDGLQVPNWPENVSRILQVSPDGAGAIIRSNYDNVHSFFLEFATGAMTELDNYEPRPSPDLNWLIYTDLYDGAKIQNRPKGTETDLCVPYNSVFRWSSDSKTLIVNTGESQTVVLIDIPSLSCQEVQIPGLDWGTDVLYSNTTHQFTLILPGSYSAQKPAELLVANADGSSIKKITDLPVMDHDNHSPTFLSPDGTTLYLDGYVVSTLSGTYAKTIGNAIAWVSGPPPANALPPIQLSVSPIEGPRGTRFSFSLLNGPPSQEVVWYIDDFNQENQDQVGSQRPELDAQGSLNDLNHEFGFDTGLQTEAGIYYLHVLISNQEIAQVEFRITEP